MEIDKKKAEKIELRHEAIQELLGTPPNWLIRWGISVFFGIIVTLIIGSSLFKYPQVIEAPVTITTEQPSVWVVAKSGGRIDSIYVENQALVSQNQLLAVIHNAADFQDVQLLKSFLETLRSFIHSYDINQISYLDRDLQLGELQENYIQFIKVLREYCVFKEGKIYELKANAMREEVERQEQYLYKLQEQNRIYQQYYHIAKKQYACDSILYGEKAIPAKEVDQSQQQQLSGKIQWNQSHLNITNCMIHISQLKQSINECLIESKSQDTNYQTNISVVYNQLKSQILVWEQMYLLKAPVEGKVSFSNFWGKHQHINSGENSFAVVPHSPGRILGKCNVPVSGSGKVKPGQRVIIKLDGFPYMEFGMLQGIVENVSLIPVEINQAVGKMYVNTVQVSLQEVLTTTYSKSIPFTGELTGVAEIATKEMSLLEHLISPLKYLWSKKQVGE